ncbi:MAG: Ig-like domain-containing protein, partial [Oscillochloris sp.]|nr:Ig-like domain-containing protein [Oscillochloris sp.]
MQVLRPLARIWTTLLALTAMVLGIGLMVRWLLPIGLWDTGASLSHTIPGDGATGVLPQSVLVLEFSEAMNRAATQAAIELTPA